jgi:hypothetical protein
VLDSLLSADIVRDDLVDAEEPWYGKQTSKGPESKPLQEGDDIWWKVLRDLFW